MNIGLTMIRTFSSLVQTDWIDACHDQAQDPVNYWWTSLLNGIVRKFRARVFAPGFHFFLNTGSLPIPQVWRNKTHIIFRRRKILKWKLIFNQCNQISNRNTASFLLYKFQLSFNHNRLYFLSCCCSDSSLLTPKL